MMKKNEEPTESSEIISEEVIEEKIITPSLPSHKIIGACVYKKNTPTLGESFLKKRLMRSELYYKSRGYLEKEKSLD